MSTPAPAFRVVAVDCFERPLQYRLPFRFGAATVAAGTQAFVRARIRLADGREAEGATAELMVPKWFDKDPARSNEDNIDQLRISLRIAASAYAGDRTPRTAFDHFATRAGECREDGERRGLPALAAGFGAAEVDRAVLDALCRALRRSVFDVVRSDAIGFRPAVLAADLADFDAPAFLARLPVPPDIAVRHTVGMVDELRGAPGKVDDGLPESLEQAIERYGLRWFKLKLSGDPHADCERLAAIACVLDTLPAYRVTLDGNEQYADLDALRTLIDALANDAALARLGAAVAFIEQPLPRQATFDARVSKLPARFPLLIDEADATLDAFPRAVACGYRGVSSKSCKGLYKSLVNAARCAAWSGAPAPTRFVSAEDLTTPAGLAVQQDTALAALIGVAHVERNGHHYIDGFTGTPGAEQRAFLAAHPDLYEGSGPHVRLAIRAGALDLHSIGTRPGFASAVLPDFTTLAPLADPRAATLTTA